MKKLVYCTVFIALFFASIYDANGMKRKVNGEVGNTTDSVTNETIMPTNTDEGMIKKKRRTEGNSSSQVDPIAAETASNSLPLPPPVAAGTDSNSLPPPPPAGSSTDSESEEDEYPTFIDAMGSSAFLFPFESDNDNKF